VVELGKEHRAKLMVSLRSLGGERRLTTKHVSHSEHELRNSNLNPLNGDSHDRES
jgi:hypothetical protein